MPLTPPAPIEAVQEIFNQQIRREVRIRDILKEKKAKSRWGMGHFCAMLLVGLLVLAFIVWRVRASPSAKSARSSGSKSRSKNRRDDCVGKIRNVNGTWWIILMFAVISAIGFGIQKFSQPAQSLDRPPASSWDVNLILNWLCLLGLLGGGGYWWFFMRDANSADDNMLSELTPPPSPPAPTGLNLDGYRRSVNYWKKHAIENTHNDDDTKESVPQKIQIGRDWPQLCAHCRIKMKFAEDIQEVSPGKCSGDRQDHTVFKPDEIAWVFGDEFVPEGERSEVKIWKKNAGDDHAIDVNDVTQGGLGNCWVVAALAAFTEWTEDIESIFLLATKDSIKYVRGKKQTIALFVDGNWQKIQLQDRFVKNVKNSQARGHAVSAYLRIESEESRGLAGGELWPAYLEKAFATRYGGFNCLINGQATDALRALSGFPVERIKTTVKKRLRILQGSIQATQVNGSCFTVDVLKMKFQITDDGIRIMEIFQNEKEQSCQKDFKKGEYIIQVLGDVQGQYHNLSDPKVSVEQRRNLFLKYCPYGVAVRTMGDGTLQALGDHIEEFDRRQYAMVTTMNSWVCEKTADKMGLITGHAYTLMNVQTFTPKKDAVGNITSKTQETVRLVELRNPWGKKEWQGEWGDNDPRWKSDAVLNSIFHPKKTDENPDDGKFFMDFADFEMFFGTVDVCHRTTGKQVVETVEGKPKKVWDRFKQVTRHVKFQKNVCFQSTGFMITVPQGSNLKHIAVSQHDHRLKASKDNCPYFDANFIMKKDGQVIDILGSDCERYQEYIMDFGPGQYELIPFTGGVRLNESNRTTADAFVTVYTEGGPVQISQSSIYGLDACIDPIIEHAKKTTESDWTNKEGGKIVVNKYGYMSIGKTMICIAHNLSSKPRSLKCTSLSPNNMVPIPGLGFQKTGSKTIQSNKYKIVFALHPKNGVSSWGTSGASWDCKA